VIVKNRRPKQKILERFASGEKEPTMSIRERKKLPVREIPKDDYMGDKNLKLWQQ
jgi:hypothetical protein